MSPAFSVLCGLQKLRTVKQIRHCGDPALLKGHDLRGSGLQQNEPTLNEIGVKSIVLDRLE